MRNVSSSPSTDPVVATDGREIGQRALATRRKLLDSTKSLLTDGGLFELRLVDITSEVDASPATFYQYFSDIDAALLALADEVRDASGHLVELLDGDVWSTWADFDRALAFIEGYNEYWEAHGSVLRVRNLKAEEGEPAFREARSSTQLPLMRALARHAEASVKSGRMASELDAVTIAAAMLAMLERLTAYRDELTQRGSNDDAHNATLATVLFQSVTGITRH